MRSQIKYVLMKWKLRWKLSRLVRGYLGMMHSEIMAIGLLTSSERRDHATEVNELKKMLSSCVADLYEIVGLEEQNNERQLE